MHIVYHVFKIKSNLHTNEMPIYFHVKNSKLADYLILWVVGHQCVSELIFILFIIAENTASHKYIVQNGRSWFRAISEIVRNFILILSQIQ